MDNVLEVRELSIQFCKNSANITVVEDFNLQLKKGESLGIVGESGCGKSVTSLAIMKLLGSAGKIANGSILLNGIDLRSLNNKEMQQVRGKEVAMIFQDPMTSLNPVLTIGKQISEVLEKHEKRSKAETKQKVMELLTQVGIARAEEIYSEYPHRLSGGMRQRVMIAMAIACNPQLLIADEPTTALDVTIQAQILDLIKKIQKEAAMSLIMITHDLGVVAEVCDKVMVMYAGQVVEVTDVRTLLRHPKHPYTVGLLQSIPKKGKSQRRLYSVSGSVPSPEDYPKGCRFSTRCDKVMPVCLEENPALCQVDQQTACRCWLYQEKTKRSVVSI
ncbi:ABC transporter ATP-binding protein [Brevibacillus fluminis]|uniref:ABC transporter ATP-binding protein n=1 Tax=Brevibacillus fluminis TaxID=511487 RepID=A0A3M8DGB7_9BACL|nr:ABC transporter ATP-binding protein [Brevibacillus fluminis]RNB87142.1 ABC transporter ATP-binding protein [Brevibacillus fluminis]